MKTQSCRRDLLSPPSASLFCSLAVADRLAELLQPSMHLVEGPSLVFKNQTAATGCLTQERLLDQVSWMEQFEKAYTKFMGMLPERVFADEYDYKNELVSTRLQWEKAYGELWRQLQLLPENKDDVPLIEVGQPLSEDRVKILNRLRNMLFPFIKNGESSALYNYTAPGTVHRCIENLPTELVANITANKQSYIAQLKEWVSHATCELFSSSKQPEVSTFVTEAANSTTVQEATSRSTRHLLGALAEQATTLGSNLVEGVNNSTGLMQSANNATTHMASALSGVLPQNLNQTSCAYFESVLRNVTGLVQPLGDHESKSWIDEYRTPLICALAAAACITVLVPLTIFRPGCKKPQYGSVRQSEQRPDDDDEAL